MTITSFGRPTLVNIGILLASAILAGLFGAATLEAIEVGERAPDFELPATTGGNIKLSQFLGKQAVLVEFYGADFSPV
jgi:hypothetical protein